jgi:hypothetical protein
VLPLKPNPDRPNVLGFSGRSCPVGRPLFQGTFRIIAPAGPRSGEFLPRITALVPNTKAGITAMSTRGSLLARIERGAQPAADGGVRLTEPRRGMRRNGGARPQRNATTGLRRMSAAITDATVP